jgi:rhodanese-related sulfurtransferase
MFGYHKPKVPEVDASDVYSTLLSKKNNKVIIDVRTPEEYSRGNIEGSINIPIDLISSKIEDIIPDKEKTIYLYCLSGSRSASAAHQLMLLGYKNIYNMTSGLLAWRANKFPLISP